MVILYFKITSLKKENEFLLRILNFTRDNFRTQATHLVDMHCTLQQDIVCIVVVRAHTYITKRGHYSVE